MSTHTLRRPTNSKAKANLERFLGELENSTMGNGGHSFDSGQCIERPHEDVSNNPGRPRSRARDRGTWAYSWNRNGDLHRNYDLWDEDVERMKLAYSANGEVPNPQSAGCYHSIIEALKALGTNEMHTFHALRAKVEELMGPERWNTFCRRMRPRAGRLQLQDMTPDVDAKLHCNCRVLQRTKHFGKKLLQVGQRILGSRGCVIDVIWNEDEALYCYRLNTDSDTPLYHPPPGRKRGRRRATSC